MPTPGEYHPFTIAIIRGGSAYSDAHEHAHLQQHVARTIAWRVWEFLFGVPVFNRLALLCVEIEAALIARHEMRGCGLWEAGDRAEAIAGLSTYVRSIFDLSALKQNLDVLCFFKKHTEPCR